MLVAQAKAAEERFFGKTIADTENERILRLLRQSMLNIVLIGMPGSGKTTIGAALAKLSGRTLVDLDEQIVLSAGKTLPRYLRSPARRRFAPGTRACERPWGQRDRFDSRLPGGIVKDRKFISAQQNARIYQIERDLALLPREGSRFRRDELETCSANAAPL
jgi:shikimate dehydrogenase